MFQVRVRLANSAAPQQAFEEDFWVDTGALYSFVPEDRLNSIGIGSFGERNLVLADGRTDKRKIGSALFRIEGFKEEAPCPVIFAPAGSLYLLGATALENFGLDADPAAKKLKPILAVIGGFIASR